MPRPSELTSHLGFWLRRLSNHVSQAFAQKLAGQGVTPAEWGLLRMLYGQEPTPPSRLSHDMGLTRGAVTKLADRLIAKGLIVRRANLEDARAQTLALTQEGARFVPVLADLADQNEIECFGALTPEEREALERLVRNAAAKLGLAGMPWD